MHKKEIQNRIINGTLTNTSLYPWMCSLNIYIDPYNYLCGGCYIGNRIILTAAHCTYSSSGSPITAGNYTVTFRTDSTSPISYNVSSVIRHPNYSPNDFHDDIALLILTSVPNNITPIKIINQDICEQRNTMTPEEECISIGFGTTENNNLSYPNLRKATLKVVGQDDSRFIFDFTTVTNDMLGAIDDTTSDGDPTQDSCQGDSGSPLFVDIAEPFVIGVVSFGEGCNTGVAGGYSRVSHLKSTFDAYKANPTNPVAPPGGLWPAAPDPRDFETAEICEVYLTPCDTLWPPARDPSRSVNSGFNAFDEYKLEIIPSVSGKIIALMSTLVHVGENGKAVYPGPDIKPSSNNTPLNVSLSHILGGYRCAVANEPQRLGTASFNCVSSTANVPYTVQAKTLSDTNTGSMAFTNLITFNLLNTVCKSFRPSPYRSILSGYNAISDFSLTITPPSNGKIIALMCALVQVNSSGKALYVGPDIKPSSNNTSLNSLYITGGYRCAIATQPSWVGTASFNCVSCTANVPYTVQAKTLSDTTAGKIAWGNLIAFFIPSTTPVECKLFKPSPYRPVLQGFNAVSDFSLNITVSEPGRIIVLMNALVQVGEDDKALFIGSDIQPSPSNIPRCLSNIPLHLTGGYRCKKALEPVWFGTASFNCKEVIAGTYTIQVKTWSDTTTGKIAWGNLITFFISDS
jgi:hypothetical protein